MRRAVCCLAVLCCWCAAPPLGGQEGRLQRVREEVRGDGDKREEPGKREDSGGSRDCASPDAEETESFFGELALYGLLAPFILPAALLGDDYGPRGYFLRHPYQHGLPGYLRLDGRSYEGPSPDAAPLDLDRLDGWMGRVTVQESNDFRGLNRVTGQLLLDTTLRLGVQTGWTWLHERPGGGRSDDLGLGDISLTFRFAQNEYVQMRAGLGARVLVDTGDARWGFNFTYGADVFPVRPLVLSAVLDLGTVGDAGVFHGRATVGAIFRGWEVFAGYDYLRIGSVDLQGPAVGLRLWF
jgi:hypothetical protein